MIYILRVLPMSKHHILSLIMEKIPVTIVVYLSDKYAHRKKTEFSSARAVKNRVLTDQREKVLCDAVEWQHEFSSGKKSLWHLL